MILITLYNRYGLQLMVYTGLVVLVVLFIRNLLTGRKGTYTNHGALIRQLWNKNSTSYPKAVRHDSKGELECRRIMEKLTQRPFVKARPQFMTNEVVDGSRMELDGYNADLKIAVEYNGRQHYEYTPYFHKSKEAFYTSKYRDKLKHDLCRKAGVKLIVVPYTVPIPDMEKYIADRLN